MEKRNWNPEWNKRHNEWQKKNVVLLQVRLFKTTDADIIAAVKNVDKPTATEVKRLLRLGIEADRNNK